MLLGLATLQGFQVLDLQGHYLSDILHGSGHEPPQQDEVVSEAVGCGGDVRGT